MASGRAFPTNFCANGTPIGARARASGSVHPIEFRGWVTPAALDAAYRSATVFALPAVVDERGDTEGLGMVLLEAMSYHVPVVTTALGGITDIVLSEPAPVRRELGEQLGARSITPEAREGIGAFLDKRAPGWVGG